MVTAAESTRFEQNDEEDPSALLEYFRKTLQKGTQIVMMGATSGLS